MSPTPPANSERFQTVVTILIAVVSTAIALVASQAAVASGNTTEAQHNGVLAKINLERVNGGSRVLLAQNRRAFDQYRFQYSLYLLTYDYQTAAAQAGNTVYDTRLRQEAESHYEDSLIAFDLVDSRYLTADAEAASGYSGFDGDRFVESRQQTAAIYQDLDSADNFNAANSFRTRTLALNAGIIVLFLSVMFLTWAQITHSPLRWVWLGAGVLIALGAAAGFLFSAAAAALGI